MALDIDGAEEGFEYEGDVQKRTRKNLAARDILSQVLLHQWLRTIDAAKLPEEASHQE